MCKRGIMGLLILNTRNRFQQTQLLIKVSVCSSKAQQSLQSTGMHASFVPNHLYFFPGVEQCHNVSRSKDAEKDGNTFQVLEYILCFETLSFGRHISSFTFHPSSNFNSPWISAPRLPQWKAVMQVTRVGMFSCNLIWILFFALNLLQPSWP